ncbi:MAG: PSD1 and planctomycete cytochrome C domain-containing protein [Pirellulales bacterium]
MNQSFLFLRSYLIPSLLAAVVILSSSSLPADEGEALFERQIRPLLVARCYSCHSGLKASGGLLLDTRDGLRKGGDSGAAVVPGKPDASLLFQAVSYNDPHLAMPPRDQGGKLHDAEIAALRTWIEQGAPDPRQGIVKIGGMSIEQAKHWWAFQPLQQVTPPVLPQLSRDLGNSHGNDVDRFLAGPMHSAGLEPLPQADPRTLVRRAFYDLTGLPPTIHDVEAFTADASDEAYSRLIDRLLDSQEYGAAWGRHWLDLVRYADTAGENTDRPLPQIWRYRNWVIDAFNRDMPYDEFVRLQLAGDILRSNETGDRYSEGVIATGYLAVARRFGHDIDKETHLMHEDVIDNLGKTYLGLTVACARCHDHRIDPIDMHDYYSLYGIFAGSRFSFSGCEAKGQPRDLVPLVSATDIESFKRRWLEKREPFERRLKELDQETAALRSAWTGGSKESLRELISRDVAESGTERFDLGASDSSTRVAIRRGEVLLLIVAPKGNHGADSTRVEWQIRRSDDPAKSWSTADLLDDLLVGNPHPLRNAREGSWAFFDWKEGPDYLSETQAAVNGRNELKAWRSGDTPSVFVNSSTESVSVWTMLPPRSFFVHPGPNGPVAVAWICPEDGEYHCTGSVSDAHPGGPDGVQFRMEHFTNPDAGPQLMRIASSAGERAKIIAERDAASGPEPQIPMAFAVVEAEPKNVRLQQRGDPEKPGDEVPRAWLRVLGGDTLPPDTGSGRRELAEWINRHPLSTRAYVNRIWQHHFGRGLVRSPNDFGARGELPTHPELLDWLCGEFLKRGRSTKELHRLIMHSAAYRRASAGGERLAEHDPDNRTLARFERRRLTAEEIRDSLLVVGGNLDSAPGAAHPFPPEAGWTYTQHTPFSAVYDNQKRTVYQMVQRQRRHPFLALFDGADPNASTASRQLTTVPTQALYFLNDPFFHAETARLAASLNDTAAADDRLQRIFAVVLQRSGTSIEIGELTRFVEDYPGSTEERWSAVCRAVAASNEFIMLD